MKLHLISHPLCPYVQRVAIALAEKEMEHQRTTIDLAAKPDWFLKISPLGRTPVLIADDMPIFESAVILEFLEDTISPALHPADPLDRASHRSWIEFGSSLLNKIAQLYNAPTGAAFEQATRALRDGFSLVEAELTSEPWFSGETFSLVDATYGPIFRYFDTFDKIEDFGILSNMPRLSAWRAALARRPSVANAVGAEYPQKLEAFLRKRPSHLATLMAPQHA